MRRRRLPILAIPQLFSFVLWGALFLRPVLVFDETLAPYFAAVIGGSLLCSVALLIMHVNAPWDRRTTAGAPVAILALLLNACGCYWALGMGVAAFP